MSQPAAGRLTTSSNALLYVGGARHIETYAYPSLTPAGVIRTAFLVVGLCSDSHGNVFVPATTMHTGKTAGAVYVYAHGGRKPIAHLALPQRQIPVDCSSDPATGNLAVTSYDAHDFAPQINIYANATGTPQTYTDDALGADPRPAYDQAGDLYVTSGGNVGAELLTGSNTLVKITTNVVLGGVAHAQWDGKYFALQSFTIKRHQGEHTAEHVYRFTIAGSVGTLEGVGTFAGWYASHPGNSWIAGSSMVATPGRTAAVWNYPAGGRPIDTLKLAKPAKAVTVSAAS